VQTASNKNSFQETSNHPNLATGSDRSNVQKVYQMDKNVRWQVPWLWGRHNRSCSLGQKHRK